jgi:DNA gyrase/topoisomerase IV subunit B
VYLTRSAIASRSSAPVQRRLPEAVYSFVNNINTIEGGAPDRLPLGTHATLSNYAEKKA